MQHLEVSCAVRRLYRSLGVKELILLALLCSVRRGSSVGIATFDGLDGPGIESRWGRNFPHPSTQVLELTQPPTQWVRRLSRGLKRPWRDVHHPPPSNAEAEGRVELYIYSPSGPSWSAPV